LGSKRGRSYGRLWSHFFAVSAADTGSVSGALLYVDVIARWCASAAEWPSDLRLLPRAVLTHASIQRLYSTWVYKSGVSCLWTVVTTYYIVHLKCSATYGPVRSPFPRTYDHSVGLAVINVQSAVRQLSVDLVC